ncbi:ABC transporter G family member 20-like [Lutzomyia longipalpis]|uniref:ABC transporter G family member 20-like n=1 Tax=Lutzomyia longipalpis TaxID=7200 RepID=UPI002483D331|nr:ABC transporter G family member 20-like [Lutzomyia longipalpis]XP_055693759.1 ABC transporter G family member 20-like [Lutzomyia longipalpis]
MEIEEYPEIEMKNVQDAEGWEERRRQFMSQPSTVSSRRLQAVCVRRAIKSYGSKRDKNVILDSLNMTVPKGVIYGLLGASGCGKTTLLSCIVGRRYLDSGELWVVGGRPGTRGSGVPGPRVGYMPQSISLYGEFTIKETFNFFGWINLIPENVIVERMEFFLKLLELPGPQRYVKGMSGGQQRRLSFAITFLADPELVILDEPTAGVDPLVRQKIWDYLVEFTKPGAKTVIVTTHYIDETRQANLIGLMRSGKILTEEAPTILLQQYKCDSLEDAFLKLVVAQTQIGRRKSIAASLIQQIRKASLGNADDDDDDDSDKSKESDEEGSNKSNHSDDETGDFGDHVKKTKVEIDTTPLPINMQLPDEDEVVPKTLMEHLTLFQMHHMKALIWKNLLWMIRNVGVLLFIAVLPVVQVCLFCEAIGKAPIDLKIAVTNNELLTPFDCPITAGCNSSYLSCRYIDFLKHSGLDVGIYSTYSEAEESVKDGDTWLVMNFPENYSQSLLEWINLDDFDNDEEIYNISMVSVAFDMSDFVITSFLKVQIQTTYSMFIQEVVKDCNITQKQDTPSPLSINMTAFVSEVPDFQNFSVPAVLLILAYAVCVTLTTGIMLGERTTGILERFMICGISGIEILISHLVSLNIVMMFQVGTVLICVFIVYDINIQGSIVLVIFMTLLNAFCGMCFGFAISCTTYDERLATYMALGSFMPSFVLCGGFWPIEGMPDGLQQIAYAMPITNPTIALRSILLKGYGLEEFEVTLGFITIIAWIFILLGICITSLKFKKE